MRPSAVLIFLVSLFCFNGSLEAQSTVEQFDDNDRKWWVGQDYENATFADIKNGSYFISSGHPVFQSSVEFKELAHDNFSVSIDIKGIKGQGTYSYGLRLGGSGQNYIELCINDGGAFVRKCENGVTTFVRDGGEKCQNSDNCHVNKMSGGKFNTLKIMKRGNLYDFFVNDVIIKSANIEMSINPAVGIEVWKDLTVEVGAIYVNYSDVVKNSGSEKECQPYDKNLVAKLRKEAAPKIGNLKIISGGTSSFIVNFYHPDAPSSVFEMMVPKGSVVGYFADKEEKKMTVGDDWGIQIVNSDGQKTCIYPLRDVVTEFENNTFNVFKSVIEKTAPRKARAEDNATISTPKLTNLVSNGNFQNFGQPACQWGTGKYAEKGIWWKSNGIICSAATEELNDNTTQGKEFLKISPEMKKMGITTALHVNNYSPLSPNVFGTTAQRIAVAPNTVYQISVWVAAKDIKSEVAASIITNDNWMQRPITLSEGSYGWKLLSSEFTTGDVNFIDLRVLTEDIGEFWLTGLSVSKKANNQINSEIKQEPNQNAASQNTKSDVIRYHERFNDASALSKFSISGGTAEIKDQKLLIHPATENALCWAWSKEKEIDYKNSNFICSAELKGYGVLYLGNHAVTFNSITGSILVSEFIPKDNKWNNKYSGNLKSFNNDHRISMGKVVEKYTIHTAFPCPKEPYRTCPEYFKVIVIKKGALTTVLIGEDIYNLAKVYEGNLTYSENKLPIGLGANSKESGFDNFMFTNSTLFIVNLDFKGKDIFGEFCNNEKFSLIDSRGNNLTECVYDNLYPFLGKYTLGIKKGEFLDITYEEDGEEYDGYTCIDFFLLDENGKRVNGNFNFNLTDPEYYNGRAEKFICSASLKNGQLEGTFTCNFANGKKIAELKVVDGKLIKGILYLPDGKTEEVKGTSDYDKMNFNLMSITCMYLISAGLDEDSRDKINFPWKFDE